MSNLIDIDSPSDSPCHSHVLPVLESADTDIKGSEGARAEKSSLPEFTVGGS